MKILDLELENPIGLNSVDGLMKQIKSSHGYSYLLVDVVDHNFESIRVIKYFREELENIQPILMEFQKIAFVSPSEFQNVSEKNDMLDYFSSKVDAMEWLKE